MSDLIPSTFLASFSECAYHDDLGCFLDRQILLTVNQACFDLHGMFYFYFSYPPPLKGLAYAGSSGLIYCFN